MSLRSSGLRLLRPSGLRSLLPSFSYNVMFALNTPQQFVYFILDLWIRWVGTDRRRGHETIIVHDNCSHSAHTFK